LTPHLATVLAQVPGVRQVTQVRTTDATVAGSAHQNVDGVDPAAIGAFTSLGLRSGTLASLGTGNLLVSQSLASGHHWRGGRPGAMGAFSRLGLGSGTLASLGTGNLLVSQSLASGHHWRVGDQVVIGFGSYGNARLRIGGIFANVGPLAGYLLSTATFAADTGI